MFLLLNPRGEDDFTKTHLQQVLKLYSKELPDKNYASNTRKQSTFLERCVSKRPLQVTGTLFLPYDSDTEPRSSTLVHLIEVSRSALTVGRDTIMQLHKVICCLFFYLPLLKMMLDA
ncbi:unnamed protein product [Brassica napus]|uniref:(rape) hypothetical protein n=1 Tax=Brassica napus TaxID=3708 RepID=A0A816IH05_BRANA|nr:unnamed protein product [Brassica napus]